jgi:hypothetical protein
MEGTMKWIEPGFFYLIHTPFGLLAGAFFVILVHAYCQYLREHHAHHTLIAPSEALAENHAPMELKPSPLPVPLIAQSNHGDWTKPRHNVQYIEFHRFTNDDFVHATLCFQNVPNGKLLGKFENPHLKVTYYNKSTGEEIADFDQTDWWSESGDVPANIGAEKRYAMVASFFMGHRTWAATELYKDDLDWSLKSHSVQLPVGDIHIIASLSGAHDPRIPRVEGILTLGENGAASCTPKIS